MSSLYENDENRWLEQQISLLKAGELEALDRANLVEYLVATATRDRRELKSRLVVLLAHVLKVRFQPANMSRSWANTIATQQREIGDLLDTMPSLVAYVEVIYNKADADTVKQAAVETGLPLASFGGSQVVSFQDAMNLAALALIP